MDYLKELWDLYESEMNVVAKPQFEPEDSATVDEPPVDDELNFRVKQSKQIAKLRQKGMGVTSAGNAYELVKGPVDTGDPSAVADLTAHMAANELDTSRAPDIDPEGISLLAQDHKQRQAETVPNDGDLRRSQDAELTDDQERENIQNDERDRLQTSQRGPKGTLDKFEEYDYNDDIAFLQKFGRA